MVYGFSFRFHLVPKVRALDNRFFSLAGLSGRGQAFELRPGGYGWALASSSGSKQTGPAYTPQCTSIGDSMVSMRWYLGCLERQLGVLVDTLICRSLLYF